MKYLIIDLKDNTLFYTKYLVDDLNNDRFIIVDLIKNQYHIKGDTYEIEKDHL